MDASVHTNMTIAAGDLTMHPVGQCLKDTVVKSVTEFLSLFYIMSPYETSKEDAYDVPDYEVVVSVHCNCSLNPVFTLSLLELNDIVDIDTAFLPYCSRV